MIGVGCLHKDADNRPIDMRIVNDVDDTFVFQLEWFFVIELISLIEKDDVLVFNFYPFFDNIFKVIKGGV